MSTVVPRREAITEKLESGVVPRAKSRVVGPPNTRDQLRGARSPTTVLGTGDPVATAGYHPRPTSKPPLVSFIALLGGNHLVLALHETALKGLRGNVTK
jgi:hypothetical protein